MLTYPLNFNKIKAIFLERINKFVIKAKLKNKEILAYLPNPGNLGELLLEGTEILLVKNKKPDRLPYIVLGCIKNNHFILLHTHLTNKIIKTLILQKRIKALKDFKIIKDEPKYNHSRFDFLLQNEKNQELKYLEVKTCTLFGKQIAMFPDAETKRGVKHLYELKNIALNKGRAEILFVIMNPEIKFFLPAYHIDINFTKALLEAKNWIDIKAISLKWDPSFSYIEEIKDVAIPFSFLEKHGVLDKGFYLLILKLENFTKIEAKRKKWEFKPGFYVYVGSAQNSLTHRIKRHLKKQKKKRWHIDYLREKAEYVKAIPIRSSENLECSLAKDVDRLSEEKIPGFGCSDCKCLSHLFYFSQNPLNIVEFQNLLIYYRIDRLCSYLK